MKTFHLWQATTCGVLLLCLAALATERVSSTPLVSATASAAASAGVAPRRGQALLGQLLQLESKPAESLQDCAKWFDLNVRYIQLRGEHKMRQGEWAKKQECDKLDKAFKQINQKLAHFKHMMHAENDQLDFVAGLVSEFLKFKKQAAEDPRFGTAIQSLIDSDPVVKEVLEKLERFAQFMAQVLEAESAQAAAAAEPDLDGDGQPDELPDVARADGDIAHGDLKELENAIKALVDDELELTDDRLNELIELADMLEKVLADGQTVDLKSGKFRYLSGALDAARAVILHKSIPSPLDDSAAHAHAASIASSDVGAHTFAHSQSSVNQKLAAAGKTLNQIPSYATPATSAAHATASAQATASAAATPAEVEPQPLPSRPAPPRQTRRRKVATDLRAAAVAQASAALQQHMPDNAKQRFGDQMAQSFAAGQFNGF